MHRFDLDGAEALIERVAAFAGRKGLAAEPRTRLEEIVGQYRAHAAARDRVRNFLRDVERHWLRYRAISGAPATSTSRGRSSAPGRSGWSATKSAAGGPRDPPRPRDLPRPSRPHRRRARAPGDRGLPAGAVLLGVPHPVPVTRQGAHADPVAAPRKAMASVLS